MCHATLKVLCQNLMIIPTPKKPKQTPQTESLDGGLVCDRNDGLWYVVLHRNCPRLSWHQGLSLQVNVGTVRLRLLLQLGVLLDSADELFSRSGQGDVLDTEVDTLLDVSVLDLLVDDDTDCALCDVVDDSGLKQKWSLAQCANSKAPQMAMWMCRAAHRDVCRLCAMMSRAVCSMVRGVPSPGIQHPKVRLSMPPDVPRFSKGMMNLPCHGKLYAAC